MEQNANSKEIAETDEELAALMAKSEELQKAETAGEPVKADYILLAKTGSKALKPKEKELYIEGLKVGDFYIQKDKKNLGNALKVVPLAFITVYNETDGTGLGARFFGMWNKEQATQFPLADDSYFDRLLPNGHILTPSNWVMVEVLGHPEIENAVIAYKRTGSRIWKAWKKDATERSGASSTLVYDISEEEYENDKNTWTDISFTFAGSLLEQDKKEAVRCLTKSNAIREAYAKHVLVTDRTLKIQSPAPASAPAPAQIADARNVADSETEESDMF